MPTRQAGWTLHVCLLLVGGLALPPTPAHAVSNFCPKGTCTIQNPVVTNVYWESSLNQWDQDVGVGSEITHKRIDDLSLALFHSGYFDALNQYNVNTPTLGTSISTAPCMAPPGDITSAINGLPALTACLFQYYPALNSGNTILNVFLPPSVATSSGWCGNNGAIGGQHDKYSTSVEITILPTNSACNPSLNALFYTMSHEMVEAATDPIPKSLTGWKNLGDAYGEIGDLCQPPHAFRVAANFLWPSH